MQGEALSPFLFSMYINDFESELITRNCESVNLRELSLFLLLFADDTVLFAESRSELQNILNELHSYSRDWGIDVNVNKTKIVVFRSGHRLSNADVWYYDNTQIEVLNSFNYLGINLFYNGKFNLTEKTIAMQGRKCMFAITKICNDTYLNVESKLSIFDTYVSSVMNYGSEVWGFHPGKNIENVHLNFCKRTLRVKSSTPNYMIYSELGRLPMIAVRKIKVVKFWLKLLKTQNCILKNLYDEMYTYLYPNSWLSNVKDLLCNSGFSDVWNAQHVPDDKTFLNLFKQRVIDNFIQERNIALDNSNKCLFYKYLLETFSLQNYLKKSMPVQFTSLLYDC